MRNQKQMKDEEVIYYKIGITRIRTRKGNKNNCEYKDKLWCVNCKDVFGGGISFCETTLKKAFSTLKHELYL